MGWLLRLRVDGQVTLSCLTAEEVNCHTLRLQAVPVQVDQLTVVDQVVLLDRNNSRLATFPKTCLKPQYLADVLPPSSVWLNDM